MRNFVILILLSFTSACAQHRVQSAQTLLADQEVRFAFGSAKINGEGKAVLKNGIEFLKVDLNKAVIIEGHTDKVGSDKSNLDLGDKRARAVKAFLIACGIEGERITTVTYGESEPKKQLNNYRENRRALLKDLAK